MSRPHLLAGLALLDPPHGQHGLQAAVADIGDVHSHAASRVVVDHPVIVVPKT